MSLQKAKTVMAWIVGIGCTGSLYVLADILLMKLGLPLFVDFGVPVTIYDGRAEYERDGSLTAVGAAVNIVVVMLGTRVGMAIYQGSLNGGVSAKGNVDFQAWFFGGIVYGVGGAILFAVFSGANSWGLNIVHNLLELILIAAIFLIAKKWTKRRLQQLTSQTSDDIDAAI